VTFAAQVASLGNWDPGATTATWVEDAGEAGDDVQATVDPRMTTAMAAARYDRHDRSNRPLRSFAGTMSSLQFM
jgi:hypothetical protein